MGKKAKDSATVEKANNRRNTDERSAAEKAKHRALIATLYFPSEDAPKRKQKEIAAELGISQATVSRDIKWLSEQWQKKAARTVKQHQDRALVELDLVKQEAWSAWHESKSKRVTAKGAIKGEFPGDPAYLGVVTDSIGKEMKIVGGEAATQMRFGNGEDEGPPVFNFNFNNVPARAAPPTAPAAVGGDDPANGDN